MLRVLFGGITVSIPISNWLFIVTAAVALMISAGKRYSELSSNYEIDTRTALNSYSLASLHDIQLVGIIISIVFYLLWSMETSPQDKSILKRINSAVFSLILISYNSLSDKAQTEAPENVILGNKKISILVLIWIITFLMKSFV